MKIIFLKKRTLYLLITIIILIILGCVLRNFLNKGEETFKRDIFYKGNANDNVIAFACNVDWGNEYIKPMLEIFEEKNINITFFVTGRWAEKNEELLKEIHKYGHEIGNHGYLHRDYGKLSYELNKEEISKTHDIIKNTIGVESIYFAPPSGAYNDNTVKAATDLNYDIIMWSVDTIDWRDDSTKEKIIERVLTKVDKSDIVLMHPTKETIEALPTLIENLNNENYKIGTISDILRGD